MLKVYHHPRCSTCKKGLAYLKKHNIKFAAVDLTETAPSLSDLRRMIGILDSTGKIFNTSGKRYRELNLKATKDSLKISEIIDLLAAEPMLIKRPFVLGPEVALIGYNEKIWDENLL